MSEPYGQEYVTDLRVDRDQLRIQVEHKNSLLRNYIIDHIECDDVPDEIWLPFVAELGRTE